MSSTIDVHAFGSVFAVRPRVGIPLVLMFVVLALFQGYSIVRAMSLVTGLHFALCLLIQIVLTLHLETKTDSGGKRAVALLPAWARCAVNWLLVLMTIGVLVSRAEWVSLAVVGLTATNALLNTVGRIRRGPSSSAQCSNGMFAQGFRHMRYGVTDVQFHEKR